jgi:hypothetical protein
VYGCCRCRQSVECPARETAFHCVAVLTAAASTAVSTCVCLQALLTVGTTVSTVVCLQVQRSACCFVLKSNIFKYDLGWASLVPSTTGSACVCLQVPAITALLAVECGAWRDSTSCKHLPGWHSSHAPARLAQQSCTCQAGTAVMTAVITAACECGETAREQDPASLAEYCWQMPWQASAGAC